MALGCRATAPARTTPSPASVVPLRSRFQPVTEQHRRGLTAAGSAGWGRRRARDRQQGQAAADGSPLRCAPSAFMNGGGCAAARVSGDRWAMPAWAPAARGDRRPTGCQHRGGGFVRSRERVGASGPGGGQRSAAPRRIGSVCRQVTRPRSQPRWRRGPPGIAIRPELDRSVSGILGRRRPAYTVVIRPDEHGGRRGQRRARPVRRAFAWRRCRPR